MGSAVHRELPDLLQLQPQLADGPGTFVQFLPGRRALHGQHRAPHLYIGGGQLQQNIQPCHGPGSGIVVLLPAARHGLLSPGSDAPGGNAQLRQGLLQPFHPLAQRVQQRDPCLRAGDGQGDAGKARAAAHVDEALACQIHAGKQGQAVQQVELRHLVLLRNGGEVHDLVLLHHCPGKGTERLLGIFRQVQAQKGQTRGQCCFHHSHHLALTMPLRSTWVSS